MAAAVAPVARSSEVTQPASSSLPRTLLVLLVAGAAVGAFFATSPQASARAVAEAGPELTRLLRGMALLKALLAAGALGGVLFRLAAPVSPARFALYTLACSAMAAGTGLIWQMDLLRTGALLLHAGLLVTVVMVWRDPATARLLEDRIAARRARRHTA